MTVTSLTTPPTAAGGEAPSVVEPGAVSRADGAVAASSGLLRIGTRGSALAVSQTTTVAEAIARATGVDVVLVIITTHGDVSRAPLAQLGGTGVFVSALREALVAGECDLAVHSLKDLPTGPCDGIALGAVPARADPRDALCARAGMTLETLPVGARVGTGSPRRAAQLLARRPDLQVSDIRGNVDTRLARISDDLDAVVLAAAGLDRIGRSDAISERFSLETAPPAPGQGALAIEVRDGDTDLPVMRRALAALNDPRARAEAIAERALLGTLEAGCAAPIGATAAITDDTLTLSATVYRLDGSEQLTATASAPWEPGMRDDEAPTEVGRRVARELLDRGAERLAPLGGTR
ncbi:hydroxymethylbilane synthase [Leucobacter aridicollis]|uniref:hydroxymethylbilane synthase n=1 Tax=Leucobacter aridicollis TaxID=283878 RepID=UPI002103228E|nr:hydroxymethylbilane synthase [Leucobacter aridicollis]UTX53591.1 hydroxymethylbilane synthase [Leucobacter aridicollis]